MPDIQAFHGLRYDLGHVGSLSDVIAPPYDVIDRQLQDELYKKHPANVVRLILNRTEPGDSDTDRYQRASRFLKNWQREGLLQQESQPSVYVYHQVFDYLGTSFTRRGFMGRLRLEPFGEGRVYPHEETHASAKADRLNLTNHCRANLSQIFGIYPDADNEAQSLLEDAIEGVAPLEATDHLGVIHRLWPVSDAKRITEVAGIMGPKPLFVADGHHRYETACNYRQQMRENSGIDAEHPANFVLTMFVSMTDPGMIVLPTHRLFRGLPPLDSGQLRNKLSSCFACHDGGEGPQRAHGIWEEIEVAENQGQIGLYTAKDDRWTIVALNEGGKKKMAEVAAQQSDDWQGLGVSLLHKLIVETLLQAVDLPKPNYVHLVEEVVDGLQGKLPDSDEHYALAALVMPATVEHIRRISEHAERMPAKSTYFYPKLLSGLVFNPLH